MSSEYRGIVARFILIDVFCSYHEYDFHAETKGMK